MSANESLKYITAETEAVHANLGQQVIITTQDKVRITLMRHVERLKNADRWQVPASFASAILMTLLTTEFREISPYIKADVVKGIFIACLVFCIIWLIKSLAQRKQKLGVDELVTIIQSSQKQLQSQGEAAPSIASSTSWIRELIESARQK